MAGDLTAFEIYKKIKHLIPERCILGLHLGIPKYRIDVIKEKYSDPDMQMIDILQFWLNMDPKASWERLATVLREDMDYVAVADQLYDPVVDEKLILSLSEHIVNQNAILAALYCDMEGKKEELLKIKYDNHDGDEWPDNDPEVCAIRLQESIENAKSDKQMLTLLIEKTNDLKQDLILPFKITEEMKQQIENVIQRLQSEREDIIFNGFDQILEQLDAITHELKIRESVTTQHRQRMAALDATTDKVDAIDKQLKDCQRVLKIVESHLQQYSEQIARLTLLRGECGYLLSLVKSHFSTCLTNILKFAERVNQWQSQVEKRILELQAEQERVLHSVYFPLNRSALFGRGRDRQMQERLREIEHKLEINDRINLKCNELLQICLDLHDVYA